MSRAYLTCRVGTEWYGVDVQHIIEVVYLVALNDVLMASHHVLGLMTLRQSLIPVLDLRRCFGITDAPLTLRTPLIAVRATVGKGAFVVDETDSIVQLNAALLDSTSMTGIQGAVRLNQRTLFLLDIDQLLQEVQYDLQPEAVVVSDDRPE